MTSILEAGAVGIFVAGISTGVPPTSGNVERCSRLSKNQVLRTDYHYQEPTVIDTCILFVGGSQMAVTLSYMPMHGIYISDLSSADANQAWIGSALTQGLSYC